MLVDDTSREAAVEFMRQRAYVDCLIPRGGPSLIRSILDNATVPYVIDGDGNCHVYVDASADLGMAADIVVNAKTQRPSVCNAAESLLVHEAVAAEFLPLVAAPARRGRAGGRRRRALHARRGPGGPGDRGRLGARVPRPQAGGAAWCPASTPPSTTSPATASGHSEAIVTGDLRAADRFTHEVDAAAVVVNASTRFVDGEEFGFGAEIGISTQKLHARGPMGLRELTTEKYVVRGDGQTRR